MKREGIVLRSYKKARFLYLKGIPILPKMICEFLRIVCGCDVPYICTISEGVEFPHRGLGVVVHPEAKIGKGTTILQNVTIGGKTGKAGAPQIGERCIIGAGACILGNVTIGDNTIIGSNSVVIHSLPGNCVAAGVPAKIIKIDIDRSLYDWRG